MRKLIILFSAIFIIPQFCFTQNPNTTLIGRWGSGPCKTLDSYRNIACIGNGSNLEIFDVSYPDKPSQLGEILLPGLIVAIKVRECYVYVTNVVKALNEPHELRIIDISDPANPVEVGFSADGGNDIEVIGNYAYVVHRGLRIFDITNPANPVEIGFVDINKTVRSVAIRDTFAYVTSSLGLSTIDISDPLNPSVLGSVDTNDSPQEVLVYGDYAYLANGNKGLRIFDISDPGSPTAISFLDTDGRAKYVEISGDYAYLAEGSGGLCVIDITDPENPVEIGYTYTDNANSISIVSNYIYVADYNSLRIINISNPVNAYVAGAYVAGGNFYDVKANSTHAFIGGTTGFYSIDLAEPTSLVDINLYKTPGTVWDIELSGNMAMVTSDHGLSILDISDPAITSELGFLEVDFPDGNAEICLADTLAFIGYSKTLYIIDISDPANPSMISSNVVGDWIIELCSRGEMVYTVGGAGIVVYDVSDPFNPIEKGSYDFGYNGYSVDVSNNYAYVGCGGIMRIVDISDPSNPSETGYVYLDPNNWAYDLTISGIYAYVVGSTSGLQIINISDPTEPVIEGNYQDIVSAYGVTYRDGLIYIAGIQSGLYIIRNDLITSRDDTMQPDIDAINIFPNPTSGIINISGSNEPVEIKIFSVQGQLLKTENHVENTIDISDLPTSVYFLNLTSGNGALKRIILKK